MGFFDRILSAIGFESDDDAPKPSKEKKNKKEQITSAKFDLSKRQYGIISEGMGCGSGIYTVSERDKGYDASACCKVVDRATSKALFGSG